MPTMETKYVAAMVLSGVGDALGYYSGSWEFNFVGESIHEELEKMGGLEKIEIKNPDWPVSDDTVLHLATAEGLVSKSKEPIDREQLFKEIAFNYKEACRKDMNGRSAGMTTLNSCHQLCPNRDLGWRVPFNNRGGGCGASMRSMCIGLRYPNYESECCLQRLIAVSVETSRMTHHHPTGYLGGFASALFTALAIKDVKAYHWGHILLKTIPLVKDYIQNEGVYVNENLNNFDYFASKWQTYLNERGILDGQQEPKFPSNYGVKERDVFYKSFSYAGWAGASGDDSVIIAYDAFLAHQGSWDKLCKHGMLHGGDSDSTGVMAGCWFGATNSFSGVPENNYKKLEYKDRLIGCGRAIYDLACKDGFI